MKNHFATFSLPVTFEIDLMALESQYLDFQKKFHPDSANSSDIENSIAINEAYKILSDPLRRAAHILQLNNIDIENDSTAPKVDMKTLTEVLELQEQIAEISSEEISSLQKEVRNKIKLILKEVTDNLAEKNFPLAAQILIKAKYFDKVLQDLKLKKQQ